MLMAELKSDTSDYRQNSLGIQIPLQTLLRMSGFDLKFSNEEPLKFTHSPQFLKILPDWQC